MNNDMFCVIKWSVFSRCRSKDVKAKGKCKKCLYYKHKWPTPAQFRKEYCREVPTGQPCYVSFRTSPDQLVDWRVIPYAGDDTAIVIACTPYGIPPVDYKAEFEMKKE